jgi:hypothetical protein
MSGNSMFPDPSEPPQLVQTAAQGPWGDPKLNLSRRSAEIQASEGSRPETRTGLPD